MLAFPPNTLHGFIAVKVGWRWLLPLLLPSLMVLNVTIKGQRGPLHIRPSSQSAFCSVLQTGGLSVQPAAMEKRNTEMEEIWESKLPARRGLLTTACHRPVHLSGQGFFDLFHHF